MSSKQKKTFRVTRKEYCLSPLSINFYEFFFADLARLKVRVKARVVEAVGEALHVAGEEEGGGGEAVGGVDGLKSQSPQLNSWMLN